MDNRERILAAMTWEEPDQVPLTIYDWMIPRGSASRDPAGSGQHHQRCCRRGTVPPLLHALL
jgi:hypothetical protein